MIADCFVAALDAKAGKLDPTKADTIALELRIKAGEMDTREDAWMLRKTAGLFEQVHDRVKVSDAVRDSRPRAKAGGARRTPTIPELLAQADREQMERGGGWTRTESEELERERVRNENERLRRMNEQAEAKRRRQVGEPEGPEEPWWRR